MHYSNDYINKNGVVDTLKISAKIKQEIHEYFKQNFKLIDINQKIVTNKILNNTRSINFDNYEEFNINYLNDNNNLYLYEKLNALELQDQNGLISYCFIINRDIKKTNENAYYEFVFYGLFKTMIANSNMDYLTKLSCDIIEAINNLEVVKEHALSITKIKIIDANKVFKQYQSLKAENILKEITFRYGAVLLTNCAGNNTKKYHFINNNIIYGSNVASLFVYNKTNNTILKIMTVYTNACKQEFKDKWDQDINLQVPEVNQLIEKAEEYNDLIGFEFYLSQYLVYSLSKYSIDEIID